MDDLDRLLAETMRAAAVRAPADDGLLGTVHRRSDRYRRQRIAIVASGVLAALAVGIPAVLVTRSTALPPAVTPTAPAANTVRLVSGYSAPTFPYTLPATTGMRAPVASMAGGNPVAFFESTEQRHHADITVTVSSGKPAFHGPATEKPVQVRGHAGVLRTVDVEPAAQLTVYWPESPSRWIQLATDDTYSPQKILTLAGSLAAASIAVLPPFRLELSPAGLVADTVSESTMSFGTPAADRFEVVLRKPHPLGTVNATVGRYPASLTHTADGVTLEVDVAEWDATLEVRVGRGLTMSDADLVRFAAGVQILDRSDPQ